MSATFTITRLLAGRALVKGTDVFGTEGKVILDTTEWDRVNEDKAYDTAQEAFAEAVNTFFAPLLEAAEAANKTINNPQDPASYIVKREAVEGVEAVEEILIRLSHDSIVLRLIEQGNYDRLVWVGDALEILEVEPMTGIEVPDPDQPSVDESEIHED